MPIALWLAGHVGCLSHCTAPHCIALRYVAGGRACVSIVCESSTVRSDSCRCLLLWLVLCVDGPRTCADGRIDSLSVSVEQTSRYVHGQQQQQQQQQQHCYITLL